MKSKRKLVGEWWELWWIRGIERIQVTSGLERMSKCGAHQEKSRLPNPYYVVIHVKRYRKVKLTK